MRRSATLPFALLAATLLPAAKPVPVEPPPPSAEDRLQSYRGQGISVCIAELRAVPDLGPDDLESICGCAFDRFLRGRNPASLPEIAPGRFRGVMEGPLLSCTAETRPDRTSQVARRGISMPAPPVVSAPPPLDAKPQVEESAPVEDVADNGGGGFWAWLSSLALPAWLTGASLLWWIAIGIFVLGLLILAFRRRDPRQDLSAPPSHMRRGMPPAPPRRPDLPR